MSAPKIRLLLVEDHRVTMAGLRDALGQMPEIEIVGTAYDSDTGLDLLSKQKPDAVLLDLHLPGSRGPKSTVETFCKSTSAKVIVFTSELGAAFVQSVFKAGAAAYLLKSETPERILEVIKTSLQQSNKQLLSKELVGERPKLTEIEQQILVMLANGKKYNDIATERCTSPATIRRQCEDLQIKLNLNSREELIAWAANNGYARLGSREQ